MALDIDRNTSEPRRYVGVGILGALLLLTATAFYFLVLRDSSPEVAVPIAYEYTVNQNVDSSVRYNRSSFFEDQDPGPNGAYVARLTESIRSHFHYSFSGSKSLNLTYTYDVNAVVRAPYALKEEEKTQATVWTKKYQLVDPTTQRVEAKSFSLDPIVEIPFAEYKALIDQLNTAFELSLAGEVVVTSTVRVTGEVDGVSFEDRRVSSVTAPLNEQLFTLAIKFDKRDTGQVASGVDRSWKFDDHYLELATGLVAVFGLALLVYGFRSQIFKTPYQRELDRIYRYHDGIIIRARKAANLKNKNVVGVHSFEDLLNLEEELKEPIVATPAGAEATHFIIVHNDVLYVYTLGNVLLEESTDEIEESIEEEIAAAEVNSRPKRRI